MTTAAVITGLVVPIVGFLLWLLRRKIETKESANSVANRYEQELHNAIGNGNQRDINMLLDKRLSVISRNQQGPRGSEAQSGKRIPYAE